MAGLITAFCGGLAQANPPAVAPVAMPPAAAQPATPTASNVLEEGITKLNLFIASGMAQDPAAMQRFVDETIKPFFDFKRMAKLAAGPAWAQMNAQQQEVFIRRIEGMFLKAFIRNVVSHRGPPPRTQFLPPRPSKDAKRIDLMARLLFPEGRTTRLVFRFAKAGGKWRAFDVSVDGKSAVLYYRSHFMKLARDGGIPAMLGS
jgi:phospholipid transport system substrate-binding protein